MLEWLNGFVALSSEGVSRFQKLLVVYSLLPVRFVVKPFVRVPLCGRWRTHGNTTSRPRVDRPCCTWRSVRLCRAHMAVGRGSCEEGAVEFVEVPAARVQRAVFVEAPGARFRSQRAVSKPLQFLSAAPPP